MDKEKFGKRISQARENHDPEITQENLAAYLGVSPQAVSGWERGKYVPALEKLPLMAEYLGVSLDYLFDVRGGGSPDDTEELIHLLQSSSPKVKEAVLLLLESKRTSEPRQHPFWSARQPPSRLK